MRVLVTGSHGFIGSNLVKALKERGDEVFEWDLKNGKDLLTPLIGWEEFKSNNPEEVYHLACMNQEEATWKPAKNLEINARGADIMVYKAKQWGSRFVYTSTASVYGNQITQPIGSRRVPDPKTDYAVAKLAGEHFVKNSGVDFTIFRLSNVYGPGQSTENPYCGVVAKFIEAIQAQKPIKLIGDGSQTRDFTFVGDVVTHLMDPSHKGTLNVSYGKETSVMELADTISTLVDPVLGTYSLQFAPERLIDGIQRRVLRSDVVCGTSLEKGLQRTLDWVNSAEKAETAVQSA